MLESAARRFRLGSVTMRPVIAVTRAPDTSAETFEHYLRALREAGAEPVPLLPGEEPPADTAAILLSGGGDVNPARYGQEPHPATAKINDARDEMEIALATRAYQEDIPVLAICRGIQVLAVALGGTLLQDIPDHRRAGNPTVLHGVNAKAGSLLARILGRERVEQVTSSHHQAVAGPPESLEVTASSDDGTIEAMEAPEKRFLVAVQWHPERMPDRPEQRALFSSFVRAALQGHPDPDSSGEWAAGG